MFCLVIRTACHPLDLNQSLPVHVTITGPLCGTVMTLGKTGQLMAAEMGTAIEIPQLNTRNFHKLRKAFLSNREFDKEATV